MKLVVGVASVRHVEQKTLELLGVGWARSAFRVRPRQFDDGKDKTKSAYPEQASYLLRVTIASAAAI